MIFTPLASPLEPTSSKFHQYSFIINVYKGIRRYSQSMSAAGLLFSPWTVLAGLSIFFLYPYLVTYSALRGIPGPFAARLSNLWLLITARLGKRSLLVHEAHKKYGPVVRVQPNHISVNDDAAIPIIYGHGNGFLKSYGSLQMSQWGPIHRLTTVIGNSMMRLYPFSEAYSTLALAQSMPGSARSCPTPSVPNPSASLNPTSSPV